MRIVRALFRLAVYIATLGTLLVIWVNFLARIGVSSEDLTAGWGIVSIPFMLSATFFGGTSAREKNVAAPRPTNRLPDRTARQ